VLTGLRSYWKLRSDATEAKGKWFQRRAPTVCSRTKGYLRRSDTIVAINVRTMRQTTTN
jgi:hypothetical protein